MSVDAVGNGGARPERSAQLREIAQGFESIFLNLLMKSMRNTVEANPMFSGGRGEEMFTQLMDTAVTDASVKRGGGGIGIADMIVEKYERAMMSAEDLKGQVIDIQSTLGDLS